MLGDWIGDVSPDKLSWLSLEIGLGSAISTGENLEVVWAEFST
jgi:hypothetical protein